MSLKYIMQEKQFIIKLKGFFFTFKYIYFKNQTNS